MATKKPVASKPLVTKTPVVTVQVLPSVESLLMRIDLLRTALSEADAVLSCVAPQSAVRPLIAQALAKS